VAQRSPALAGAGCFALGALAVVLATWNRTVGISNDGIQYVEGARQLLAGRGYSTGILYFDEHYRSGRLPAPQTVWPPGTSLAIAAVAALGVEPEVAGRLVARTAFLFLPPLVFLVALRLTGQPLLAGLCAMWQLGMTEFWMYLASPNSDLLFLAASLGALVAIPDGEADEWRWLPAYFFAGHATAFRYVGVFLIAALGLLLLRDALRRRQRAATFQLRPFLLAFPGVLIAAALLVRNRVLAGDIRGGNTHAVSQPVTGLLTETLRSLLDLLGGVSRSDLTHGGLRSAAALAGLVGLGGLTILAAAGLAPLTRGPWTEYPPRRYALGLALYAALYLAAVIWTSSRTNLTYGTRYLLPIAPLLVCLAVFLATGRRPAPVKPA
jgi:hypothetical protein